MLYNVHATRRNTLRIMNVEQCRNTQSMITFCLILSDYIGL